MEIGEIRFSHVRPVFKDNGKCGICSVALDNSLVLHGVKVLKVEGIHKVLLPERSVSHDGKVKPVVTFLGDDFKEKLSTAVLNSYYREVSNR